MRTQKHKFLVEWEVREETFTQKNFYAEASIMDPFPLIPIRIVYFPPRLYHRNYGETPVWAVDENDAITIWESTFPETRIVNIT